VIKPSYIIAMKPSHIIAMKPSYTIVIKPSYIIAMKPSYSILIYPSNIIAMKPSYTIVIYPSFIIAMKLSYTSASEKHLQFANPAIQVQMHLCFWMLSWCGLHCFWALGCCRGAACISAFGLRDVVMVQPACFRWCAVVCGCGRLLACDYCMCYATLRRASLHCCVSDDICCSTL
jgi:hypothetical protein